MKSKKLNVRNLIAGVGSAFMIPLMVGYPLFPDWFRPRIYPIVSIIFGICAALVLLYNKHVYGVYLPGPPKE